MFTVKHRRKAISLERKIQILDRLVTGEGSTAVGRYFDISEATVRSIKKNEMAIRAAVHAGSDLNAKSTTYTKDTFMVKMEAALIMWIEENERVRQFPLDGITIKTIALMIHNQIKENENVKQKEMDESVELNKRKHEFSASNGWLRGFLKRNSLDNIKMKADTAIDSVDITDKEFKEKLNDIIKRSCVSDNVWVKGGNKHLLEGTYQISDTQEKLTRNHCVSMKKRKVNVSNDCSNEEVKSIDTISSSISNNNNGEVYAKFKSIKNPIQQLDQTREECKPRKILTNNSKKYQRARKHYHNKQSHDPLYMNFIEEGTKLANEVCEHFFNHDWNQKRASKFQRDIKSLMQTYYPL